MVRLFCTRAVPVIVRSVKVGVNRARSENIFRFDVHLHLNVEIRKHLRRKLQRESGRLIVDDRETTARERVACCLVTGVPVCTPNGKACAV